MPTTQEEGIRVSWPVALSILSIFLTAISVVWSLGVEKGGYANKIDDSIPVILKDYREMRKEINELKLSIRELQTELKSISKPCNGR